MAKSLVLVLGLAAFILGGCGSGEVTKIMAVEERFAHAKALFDDHDYLAATNEFTVITLPGPVRFKFLRPKRMPLQARRISARRIRVFGGET